MKQQCQLSNLYVSWIIYPLGVVFLLVRGSYVLLVVWLLGVPLVQWAYVRAFPRLSNLLGYGRVDDEPASAAPLAAATVTIYTALGCPFCPLMEERLEALRAVMGFDLKKVDVTLRPDLLTGKGIRSVPVVESGDRQLIGLATSRQLADLIAAASPH